MNRYLVISTAITLFVAGVTAALGYAHLHGQLTTRPPLAVIDYQPIANALAMGTDPVEIEPYLQAYKRRARLFKDAGYVVINRVAVEGAPGDTYIPALEDLPKDWLELGETEDGEPRPDGERKP